MASSFAAQTDTYRALCETYAVPFFHQPWWLDAVCSRWLGVTAEDSSNEAALWPVPYERKLSVSMSRNPALTPYLGPVEVCNDASETSYSAPDEKTLHILLRQLPKFPVWQVAAHPFAWQKDAFEGAGFAADARPTYLLPLDGSEEQLLEKFHPEVRRSIRRAADTISIQNEPDVAAAMYALQRAAFQRKRAHLHHTSSQLEHLIGESHRRNSGVLWIARVHGEIVGAQWSVWDGQCCYNLASAKAEGDAGRHVTAALLWQAIRHARNMGLSIFDFEGSSIPGIAKFFAQFGGERHEYLTLQKNTSPVWKLVRRLRG